VFRKLTGNDDAQWTRVHLAHAQSFGLRWRADEIASTKTQLSRTRGHRATTSICLTNAPIGNELSPAGAVVGRDDLGAGSHSVALQ
jgi:hypothetical protein